MVPHGFRLVGFFLFYFKIKSLLDPQNNIKSLKTCIARCFNNCGSADLLLLLLLCLFGGFNHDFNIFFIYMNVIASVLFSNQQKNKNQEVRHKCFNSFQ